MQQPLLVYVAHEKKTAFAGVAAGHICFL